MKATRRALLLLALFAALAAAATASADTAIGDWGHFVSYKPKMFLHNPDGGAFHVTVHVMRWPIGAWNKPAVRARLTGPGGEVVVDGDLPLANAVTTIEVAAGQRGTYLLEPEGNTWVSSTLDRAVLWTGETKGHAIEGRRAVFQASVPRRWWFWVPAGVTQFTCKAQRADRYMSQREDWGFFIVSPRGQRVRAIWGQPPHTPAREYRQEQTAVVEVEPGAGGRFWALEVRFGDSHNYSNINICFDGVPPYLARSPEEWFDPAAGTHPEIPLYDETPFIQSARIEPAVTELWPNLQHFSPCPSLGDPDGIEVLGDARFALWNPEGRELGFRIGTYLPRKGKDDPHMATVRIEGPKGKPVLEKELAMLHIHGKDGHPTETVRTGKGVSVVHVGGVERWLSFTYPATPLVLVGEETKDGWNGFRMSAGTARNWYFHVPRGTVHFSVRVTADMVTDAVDLEVRTPDRTVAAIYGNRGARTVHVPPGMDGRIWHLRPDVGSASRMVTTNEPYRYQDIPLTLELKGVPPYLAPTWEQWFDPDAPRTPWER